MTQKRLPSTEPMGKRLLERAKNLNLWGMVAHWDEFGEADWPATLIEYEEEERHRRSLERRISRARLGRFRPMTDFDWSWPEQIDREMIEELFTFGFVDEGANVVLVGPNGVGKTMIAKNLCHQAVLQGHTARFTTASEMLNDLASLDGASALKRSIAKYCHPHLLAIDEVGYLSYGNRHADLLFEVITRRYGEKSTLVTTNKPFAEWNEVFPNATCVVTLIDRLVHKAEIVTMAGESYRLKEAKERSAKRADARKEKAAKKKGK